jgi:AcrR family transcriptional regulator
MEEVVARMRNLVDVEQDQVIVAKAKARNSEATKQRIVQAARKEFARFGYSGARIERIAKSAKANIQLLYRYFGKKSDLYVAALEATYSSIRNRESLLDLTHLSPLEGIQQLVGFTFDYLSTDPFFVRLMMNENLMEGEYVKRSKNIPSTSRPLLLTLSDLLKKGQKKGMFIKIDPAELYITILSLGFVHVSNKHTLRIMFGKEIADKKSLQNRRKIAIRTITLLLTSKDD